MSHLGAKTYIPTLVRILQRFCVYAQRYRDTILANLSGDAKTAFQALMVACDVFLDAVGELPINP